NEGLVDLERGRRSFFFLGRRLSLSTETTVASRDVDAVHRNFPKLGGATLDELESTQRRHECSPRPFYDGPRRYPIEVQARNEQRQRSQRRHCLQPLRPRAARIRRAGYSQPGNEVTYWIL